MLRLLFNKFEPYVGAVGVRAGGIPKPCSWPLWPIKDRIYNYANKYVIKKNTVLKKLVTKQELKRTRAAKLKKPGTAKTGSGSASKFPEFAHSCFQKIFTV